MNPEAELRVQKPNSLMPGLAMALSTKIIPLPTQLDPPVL